MTRGGLRNREPPVGRREIPASERPRLIAEPWKWPEGSLELALLNLASFGAALAAVAIWRATPIATKIAVAAIAPLTVGHAAHRPGRRRAPTSAPCSRW